MKIFKNKKNLQKKISQTKNLSFIPTMGSLHKGHERLIKIAKKKFKKVLVSIFVNPKQFNSKEDFRSYPRNIKKDINILKRLKVDYVYIPNYFDVFSFKPRNQVFLHNFSKKLCGQTRKGHFKGVVNVINRFLEIINPKYILLGKKDFQQLFLIKNYFKKRNKSKIISCKTIRDNHKLALSSRNMLLDKKGLFIARSISKNLISFKQKISTEGNIKKKIALKIKELNLFNNIKIEYLELRNKFDLKKTLKIKNSKIFIGYYVNDVRLIDNF